MTAFNNLSPKDITQLQSYLKSIRTYSTLVEEIVNKAVSGGVGTAQRQQHKKESKIAQFRAEFRKKL